MPDGRRRGGRGGRYGEEQDAKEKADHGRAERGAARRATSARPMTPRYTLQM
jgi:hypothetical protein